MHTAAVKYCKSLQAPKQLMGPFYFGAFCFNILLKKRFNRGGTGQEEQREARCVKTPVCGCQISDNQNIPEASPKRGTRLAVVITNYH